MPLSVSETPPMPVVMQLAALPRELMTVKAAMVMLPAVLFRIWFIR